MNLKNYKILSSKISVYPVFSKHLGFEDESEDALPVFGEPELRFDVEGELEELLEGDEEAEVVEESDEGF